MTHGASYPDKAVLIRTAERQVGDMHKKEIDRDKVHYRSRKMVTLFEVLYARTPSTARK